MVEQCVTEDGKVVKVVLQEGSGELPPLHARCLVHYVSRLASTRELLVDTKAESRSGSEPVTLVAGRDASLREVGLNLGVATMARGERCRLRCAPEYAFGQRGSFSFPSVPPNADLEYEVELLDFEAVAEGRPRVSLTYEERLEAAERRRAEGNTHFQAGRLQEALARYQLALSYVDEELMMQLEGRHLEAATAARTPLLLNSAACELRRCNWHAAIAHCQEALAGDPKNAKAMFRRGKAQLQLGNTEAAARDLEAAQKLAPDDAAVARQLQELKRQVRQERAAEAQLFRGTLPPPPPLPAVAPLSPAVAPPLESATLWSGISQLLRYLQSIVAWFLPSVALYESPGTKRE